MVMLSQEELQLYRMLQGFFGEDHVIPQMRFAAVCKSAEIQILENDKDVSGSYRCLFTIVNSEDRPRLVFELTHYDASIIDLQSFQDRSHAREILERSGIQHLDISKQELEEIRAVGSGYTFADYLRDKLELA